MTPLQLKFVKNAFKHGVTEDEIWEVFLNREIPCVIVLYKTKKAEKIYSAFGLTEAGRYLEIGFIKETKNTYRVIHAMDMRKSTKSRFKKMRKK